MHSRCPQEWHSYCRIQWVFSSHTFSHVESSIQAPSPSRSMCSSTSLLGLLGGFRTASTTSLVTIICNSINLPSPFIATILFLTLGQHAKPFMNDQAVTIYNGLLWVASTQLVGYGVAGICRRFLVKPAAMYWPSVLPNVALFTALNGVDTDGDKSSKYKMSRFTFFWCVFAAIFLWQWLPGMFLVGLSTVSILCLITTNQTLLFLGSSSPGMGIGLGSFSFDWSIIGMYSPIATPWWATLNWVIGNITWQWIVIPICYYMNVWGSPALDSTYFLPDGSPFGVLNSNAIFNRNGSEVFVKRPDLNNPTASDGLFLLDQNFNLDPAKYDLHHPFFLTTFFAISYFTSFMNIGKK